MDEMLKGEKEREKERERERQQHNFSQINK